jgi:hypothetical protein
MVGEVTKFEFNPGVLPAFDDTFKVVISHLEASGSVPSLDSRKVSVTKVNPLETTFDEKAAIQITKLDWSNENA